MNKIKVEKDENGFGKSIILNASWDDRYFSYAKLNSIESLRLSFSNGWKDSDISFLKNLIFLKNLEVYSWKVTDLKPVQEMTWLEGLSFQVDLKKAFNLMHLPELKVLKAVLNPKVKGLQTCVNLRHANLVNYPFSSLNELSKMVLMERLQLKSKKLASLDGVENMRNIRIIDLSDCGSLNDISLLSGCGSLEILEIHKCKHIESFPEMIQGSRLKRLILEDCGDIESVVFLQNCTELESVFLIGNTKVKDGNLSILKRLPRLEDFRATYYKHYNISREV